MHNPDGEQGNRPRPVEPRRERQVGDPEGEGLGADRRPPGAKFHCDGASAGRGSERVRRARQTPRQGLRQGVGIGLGQAEQRKGGHECRRVEGRGTRRIEPKQPMDAPRVCGLGGVLCGARNIGAARAAAPRSAF